MPTLSSLYLMTKGNEATTSTDRRALEKLKSKVIEFHEDQPHYKRKPLSREFMDQAQELLKNDKIDLGNLEATSSSSSYESTILQGSESDRPSKKAGQAQSIDDILAVQFSWFAILWTCQKSLTLKREEAPSGVDAPQQSETANIQFMTFYKFGATSGLQIIGMITSKLEREGFWLTPSQLCENEIQGQIFDEIYDNNIIRLQDMQEKCIKFMKEEGQMDSSFDFTQLLKGYHEQQMEPSAASKGDHAMQGLPYALNQDLDGFEKIQQMIQKMSGHQDSQALYNQNLPRSTAARSFLIGDRSNTSPFI